MSTATFYFDVSCPFCWVTSRWMKEVEKVRDVSVSWLPMSLAVLNRGRDLDPKYMAMVQSALRPARVFAYVATEHPEKLDELYTAMGTKVHNEGRGFGDEVVLESLEELDIPAIDLDSDEWDKALEAFHQRAMDAVGDDVGTPVVQLGDVAFFGPVLTRIPRGEEAGTLFDASYTLAQYPSFFELKRSRTESPQFD